MPDWKEIAVEFWTNPNRMGDFYRMLCLTIQMADNENLERLRKGFPELVEQIRNVSKR